jgi:hypothetical protein
MVSFLDSGVWYDFLKNGIIHRYDKKNTYFKSEWQRCAEFFAKNETIDTKKNQ